MQHEEDFIQSICRQVTHCPAEQVILCGQENLCDLCQRQLIFAIKTQHFKEVRPCYRRLQTVQPVDTCVKYSAIGITIKENLIAFCVGQHLNKQLFCLDLSELHKILKIDVDFLLLWNSLLLYTQVIPDESTNIIFRADLYLIPIFVVIVLLLLGRQTHQDEVPDIITFAKIEAS